ncbi:MAG: ABC-2 transporter permease [Treponema sp.]|nr:ABC-2 transporter permease [Treponema sp.]
MNRVINAAKLDLYAAKSGLRMGLIAFLIPIIIGAMAQNPSITMLFVMVFATYLAGSVFSVHEKNHSDKLYGILPLKKTEMVIGRYLYALIVEAASIVIAVILWFIIMNFTHLKFDAFTFWISFALALIYYGFAVGVSFPVYLKFSFAKAYVFTMMPIYLILIGIVLLLRSKNITDNLGLFIKFLTSNLYLVPVIGIICSLVLMAVSAMIANLIYTRREI